MRVFSSEYFFVVLLPVITGASLFGYVVKFVNDIKPDWFDVLSTSFAAFALACTLSTMIVTDHD